MKAVAAATRRYGLLWANTGHVWRWVGVGLARHRAALGVLQHHEALDPRLALEHGQLDQLVAVGARHAVVAAEVVPGAPDADALLVDRLDLAADRLGGVLLHSHF